MDYTPLIIAGAAFIGAILHGWFQGPVSWKTTLITGLITALSFAGAYKVLGASLTIYDVFAALVSGYGITAASNSVSLKAQVAKLKGK